MFLSFAPFSLPLLPPASGTTILSPASLPAWPPPLAFSGEPKPRVLVALAMALCWAAWVVLGTVPAACVGGWDAADSELLGKALSVAFPGVCVTMAVVPLPTALSFSCAQIELDYQNGPMITRCSCKEQTLLW